LKPPEPVDGREVGTLKVLIGRCGKVGRVGVTNGISSTVDLSGKL